MVSFLGFMNVVPYTTMPAIGALCLVAFGPMGWFLPKVGAAILCLILAFICLAFKASMGFSVLVSPVFFSGLHCYLGGLLLRRLSKEREI